MSEQVDVSRGGFPAQDSATPKEPVWEIRFVPSPNGEARYGSILLGECKDLLRARRSTGAVIRAVLFAAGAAAVLAILIGNIVMAGFPPREAIVMSLVAGCALFVPILLWSLRRASGQEAWTRQLLRMAGSKKRTPKDAVWFRILPGGLEYRGESWCALFYWKYFERILLDKQFIFFALDRWTGGDFAAYSVPMDAFSSVEAGLSFYEAARREHEASGFGEAQRIRDVAQRFAIPCPRCAYSLAKLQEPRCPECGLRLSIPMMRLSLAVRPTARDDPARDSDSGANP